jgi:hypothetical protein
MLKTRITEQYRNQVRARRHGLTLTPKSAHHLQALGQDGLTGTSRTCAVLAPVYRIFAVEACKEQTPKDKNVPTAPTTRGMTIRRPVQARSNCRAQGRDKSALANSRRRRALLSLAWPGCRDRRSGRPGASRLRVRFLQSFRQTDMPMSLRYEMSSNANREVGHVMNRRMSVAGRAHSRLPWRLHPRPVFSAGRSLRQHSPLDFLVRHNKWGRLSGSF